MSDEKQPEEQAAQGRGAEKPHEVPARGWKSILKRTKDDIRHDHLTTVSGGVGLFFLLGLIPALAALISIYGLIANPAQIQQQFASFRHIVPTDVFNILQSEMKSIASSHKTAGWGVVIGILISIWGGTKCATALMDGLNITYHEDEKRGFFRLNLTALGLTIAGLVGVCILLGILGSVSAVVQHFHLDQTWRGILMALRWPVLFIFFMFALAVLYRYGPSRTEAKWRWVSWGAVLAAALWLVVSAAFAVYLTFFNSYNKTYGSLGAIVVLLTWLYLSVYAVLLGAELNGEMERQTARDTTKGAPKPQGWRGAFAADNLGESRP
ncbi:MAG TPA: YihY/virulence factor BrkB family protein [Candidatus Angelobacter sp.]|nr:YihY/virulence factor BrkB family protein [Candidatus Angelobacter sp.]